MAVVGFLIKVASIVVWTKQSELFACFGQDDHLKLNPDDHLGVGVYASKSCSNPE